MSDSPSTPASDRQLLITRIFEAPREEVFKAWTDPEQVAAWYGPGHMEAPADRIKIDPRVGGRWELTMVQIDGDREFSIGYEIVELVEPELLVLRADPEHAGEAGEDWLLRIELHGHGDKTRMTLIDGPFPEGEDHGHAEAGWNAALDKLGGFVSGKEEQR